MSQFGMSKELEAGLYVVGTPIGNLGDMTYRAVDTLRGVDLILAEDTRHTRKLLNHYEIDTPALSCHKYNERHRVERVMNELEGGKCIALVTDAGMPCISDPGAAVIRSCLQRGLPITAVPGPTAASTALALSGLGGGAYHFEGFLPHKSGARRRRLTALADIDCPVILYESPYRLLRLMEDIDEALGPREVFVARELTKLFEELRPGSTAAIRAAYSGRTVKGELVVIVAAKDVPISSEDD